MIDIISLHGEDTIRSYNRLLNFIKVAKKRHWDIIKISNINQNIQEAITASSLFAKNKLIIIEGYQLIKGAFVNWLNKNIKRYSAILVIYEKGQIPKASLDKITKIKKNEEYKIPKTIFTFLESFFPKNEKRCIELLNTLLITNPIEFIFSLLSSYLRDLYWVIIDPSTIPYPSWRVFKLEKQAAKFSTIKLKNIINTFAKLDLKAKTSDFNLKSNLDLVIIKELE